MIPPEGTRRAAIWQKLKEDSPTIEPSILNCDFGELAKEIEIAEAHGVKALHWDVMDGHFVPNLSYGAPIIRDLRGRSNSIFDAHLMMDNPGSYLDSFVDAGCDVITIHLEAVPEPMDLIEEIHHNDVLAGLAINPGTSDELLDRFVDQVELFLVMSVEPGFGGQSFKPVALQKLERLKNSFSDQVLLQVDGGINLETIKDVVSMGADLTVVGSAYFNADDRPNRYRQLIERSRLSTSSGEFN